MSGATHTFVGSPSTFALWAALLSPAKVIHFPLAGMFNPLWSGAPCDKRPWVLMGAFDPRIVFHDMHSCRYDIRGEAGLRAERQRLRKNRSLELDSYCANVSSCE